MDDTVRDVPPFRFSEPRQERIYHRLLLIGPGPAAFYRDTCQLMTGNPRLISITHLVSHLLREIEGALRDVLESFMDPEEKRTKSEDKGHKSEIRAVLKGLDIPETDLVAQAWLRLPDYGLHARAHRNALAKPRILDEEFR